MGWPFGEIKLAKAFEKLEYELGEYYGAINQRRMNVPVKVPEKPRAVMYVEQFEQFQTLPWSGGLVEQPHILMREMGLVKRVRTVFSQNLPKGK